MNNLLTFFLLLLPVLAQAQKDVYVKSRSVSISLAEGDRVYLDTLFSGTPLFLDGDYTKFNEGNVWTPGDAEGYQVSIGASGTPGDVGNGLLEVGVVTGPNATSTTHRIPYTGFAFDKNFTITTNVGTTYRPYIEVLSGTANINSLTLKIIRTVKSGITPIRLGGRFRADKDGTWTGSSTELGLATDEYFPIGGTGVDPVVIYNQLGAYVDSNKTITEIRLGGWTSSLQIDSFELRIYFQYGDFANGWDTNAETTRELVYSTVVATPSTGMFPWKKGAFEYVTPATGRVVIWLKPFGSMNSTRFIYLDGLIQ